MAKKVEKTKPSKKVKIEIPSIEVLQNRIRIAVQAQGSYTESLEFAIAVAAGNYMTYLKTLNSINKRAKVMFPILTREGSKAYKIYPDIEKLPSISKALKESLKSLGLTIDTIEATDDDPLDDLTSRVNAELNG